MLTRYLGLTLGLLGAVFGWEAGSACRAMAGDDEESLSLSPLASLSPMKRGDRGASTPRENEPRDADTEMVQRVRMGVHLIKRGEYSQAISILEPLGAQEDFLTLHALGVAYLRSHRNAEAYTVLIRAHQLRPAVAGPLLPAAMACARMAWSCDGYRELAQEYLALGGKFRRLANRIAQYQPYTLGWPKRF